MQVREFQRLKDQVVVITGAAQGLGEALALRLSEEGAKVVVGDMNYEAAQAVAAQLNDAIAVKLNVCDYDSCEAIIAAAVEKYGRVDKVVANAGIVRSNAIEDMTYKEFSFVVDVNLNGYFNTAKAAVKQFRSQGASETGYSIVQINSKSGKKGSAKNCAYAASKFGGIGLTESLALELAQEGIRVNSICPGNLLDSPLWVNSLYEQYARNQGTTKEKIREKYINQVPMRRGCQYDDIANVMVFLLSNESSYMTGQAINVTGGQQMQP
ncbi:MAG: sorbitol-6-phosphate dehydrogenase [Eubacteriales bacterium]|nr:sorbitol-6-phosphate dehydrogenase [Eubacteriales bacterium]